MARYTERAGYYDRNELFRLSSCLGFPGSLLADGLQSALQLNKPVSDGLIRNLLESNKLDHKLEKIFNHYSADYNHKLFLKAMSLLRHKRLGFSEISTARVAFELYRSEDGGGMIASASVVLQALIMLGRVMSPIRLETEIQKQQAIVSFPSRIQMYEFMELASGCALISTVEKAMGAFASIHIPSSTQDFTESELLPLPDFDWLAMTKEERMSAYLDKKYRNALYKKVAPTPPAPNTDMEDVLLVSRIHREESTAGSQRQLHVLMPALEQSQHQLFKARNGFTVLSKEQLHAAESLHVTRQNSRAWTRDERRSVSRTDNRSNTRAGLRSDMSARVGMRSNISSRAGIRSNINSIHVQQSSPKLVSSPDSRKMDKPQAVTRHQEAEWLPKSKSVPILPSLLGKSGKAVGLRSEMTSQKPASRSSNAFKVASTSASQFSRVQDDRGSKVAWESSPFHPGPVVSQLEVQQHRGLMDELKWEELRRKWQLPTDRPRVRSQTIL